MCFFQDLLQSYTFTNMITSLISCSRGTIRTLAIEHRSKIFYFRAFFQRFSTSRIISAQKHLPLLVIYCPSNFTYWDVIISYPSLFGLVHISLYLILGKRTHIEPSRNSRRKSSRADEQSSANTIICTTVSFCLCTQKETNLPSCTN